MRDDMHRICSWSWVLACGVIGASGCGEGAPDEEEGPIDEFIAETAPVNLRDPDMAAIVASYSDPDTVLLTGLVYPLLITAAGDAGCPRLLDNSDLDAGIVDWRLEGDCTAIGIDGVETRYQGSIVARGDSGGTMIRYLDFQAAQPVACDGTSQATSLAARGTVELPYLFVPGQEEGAGMNGALGEGRYRVEVLFTAQSMDDACQSETVGIAYDAVVDYRVELGVDEDGVPELRDVHEMEGRAAVRGAVGERIESLGGVDLGELVSVAGTPGGSWRMTARNYTFEHVPTSCLEPLSGDLILRAGGDVITIEADGARECAAPGAPQCAPWRLNGVPQPGEVCDFTASARGCAAGPDAPPPWGALALVLAGLLWQARRRCG